MEKQRTKALLMAWKKYCKEKKQDKALIAEGKPPKHHQYIEATLGTRPDGKKDLGTWWIRITGLAYPYEDGEYIVKIVAPKDYPFKPPKYYFQTPNGLYTPHENCCINIGSYHADQYRAVLGMLGFANQLIGAMLQWKTIGSGISLVKTSEEKKMELAEASRHYNRDKYPEIVSLFET